MTTDSPMTLGVVGLGRMGANIARRLMADGHSTVVHDINPAGRGDPGCRGGDRGRLAGRTWPRLSRAARGVGHGPGRADHRVDDRRRWPRSSNPGTRSSTAATRTTPTTCATRLPCARGASTTSTVGTSGGVWGAERGYCLMIGGEQAPVERLTPIFASLAPGMESAPRTPGRSGAPGDGEHGFLHCGPNGAGHFVKMVHNGIEYGLMAAYAEGLNILANADAGLRARDADAETAPLENPEHYQYELDIPAITEVWRRGSVVGSWLLDLTASALHESPELAEFSGRVSDSGEGRWTAVAAIDEGVPAPVLTAALQSRFDSQGSAAFANKVLSAMRKEFGGHHEKAE